MTKKQNGQAVAEKTAKKNGKAEVKLPGCYSRFKGNFGDTTPIRAKADHTKILSFKTYGGLRQHLEKQIAEGMRLSEIGKGLGVTAARVNELAVCLGIVRKCAVVRDKAEKKSKSKGSGKAKAKPKAKAKVVDAGDEGDL